MNLLAVVGRVSWALGRRFPWVALIGLSAQAFAVGTVTILETSSLSRDLVNGYIDVNVKVTAVASADADPVASGSELKSRISLILPGAKADPLGTDEAAAAADPSAKFFVTFRDEVQQVASASSGFVDLTYFLRINQAAANVLKTLVGSSTAVKVTARYKFKDAANVDSPVTDIAVKVGVPNEAPSGLSVLSTESTLVASWESKKSIAYLGKTATTDAPTAAVIIAIRRDGGSRGLDAKTFNADATSDGTANKCQYNAAHANGASCITCDSELDYLNVEAIKTLDSTNVFVGESTGTSRSLVGLENEVAYSVFAMYSGGIKRTACLIASPSENFTLTEFNGEGKAKASSFKCFVATAAYGSPLHPHLKLFRWFRDGFLEKTSWGAALVRTYYEWSPPLATYIETHPTAAFAARTVLWFPAMGVLGLWTAAHHPEASLLVGLILLAAFVYAGIWWRRQQKTSGVALR